MLIRVFQDGCEENGAEQTYLPIRVGVQYAVSNQFRLYSRVNVRVVNLTLLPAYVYWAPDMEPRSIHAFVKAYPSQGINIDQFLGNAARAEDSWATRKPYFNYRTLQQFPPQRREPDFLPSTAETYRTQVFSMTPKLYVYQGSPGRAQARAAQVAERLVGKQMEQDDMLRLISLNTLGTTKYQKAFARVDGTRYASGDLFVLKNGQALAVVSASHAVAVLRGAADYVQITEETFNQLDAIFRIVG